MSFSKRLRFLFRFLSALVRKQRKIIIAGLVLGAIFYFFLLKISSFVGKPKKTLKIGLVGQYLVNDVPLTVLHDLSYGLTIVSERGEAQPALAESWSVLDEGKTYIFKLKKEKVFWHDGKEFSPADINYNFSDVDFFFDKDLLTFKLKEPFAPFPIVLSKPLFKKGLIGLGDYKVKKIESQGKFIESILLVPVKSKDLPNKLYRFYNSENDLKMGFNLGEINTVENLFNLDGLYLGPGDEISKTLMKNVYVGLFFNTTNPPFASKSFRQALAYAIPKEKGEARALTPISPSSWVYNPDVKPYNQDFGHARELLKAENISQDFLITIQTFPQFEETANIVRDSWKKIGINSEVKIVSTLPENFEVLIIGREIPKDPDQYSFWHSTQEGNISQFKNFRIDKLLEDGRRTINKEERKNIYFDFQRFLVEETPVVFLSHPTVYNIKR